MMKVVHLLVFLLSLSAFVQCQMVRKVGVQKGGTTVKLSSRFAGAIVSVFYNGVEFVDLADHGRQIQLAITKGAGQCWNPTEAGTLDDGTLLTSTSTVEWISNNADTIVTTNTPAFWLTRGNYYDPRSNCNNPNYDPWPTQLSGFRLHKTTTLLTENLLKVNYRIPMPSIGLNYVQFEFTGYLTPQFTNFYTMRQGIFSYIPSVLNVGSFPVSVGGTTTNYANIPLIMATNGTGFGMGVVFRQNSQYILQTKVYGGVRFTNPSVNKWSVILQFNGAQNGREYNFDFYIGLGRTVNAISSVLRPYF